MIVRFFVTFFVTIRARKSCLRHFDGGRFRHRRPHRDQRVEKEEKGKTVAMIRDASAISNVT